MGNGIIEEVKIPDCTVELLDLFARTKQKYDSKSYIECGARSWVIAENNQFKSEWQSILEKHEKVHPVFCEFATGYNFSPTVKNTVPPHVDVNRPPCFNLLIPTMGKAILTIYKTNEDELEFRHGQKHWKMLKKDRAPEKMFDFLVEKPVLLDTSYLHDVVPVEAPRSVWCTRWIDIPGEISEFESFKNHLEGILNGY